MSKDCLGWKKLRALADQIGCTPAQIALAWVLAQGDDIVPIPGTKRRRYLQENAAAVGIRLNAEQLARLDMAFPAEAASGQRYPESMMRLVDR